MIFNQAEEHPEWYCHCSCTGYRFLPEPALRTGIGERRLSPRNCEHLALFLTSHWPIQNDTEWHLCRLCHCPLPWDLSKGLSLFESSAHCGLSDVLVLWTAHKENRGTELLFLLSLVFLSLRVSRVGNPWRTVGTKSHSWLLGLSKKGIYINSIYVHCLCHEAQHLHCPRRGWGWNWRESNLKERCGLCEDGP